MPEPITDDNRDQATAALLRVARFYSDIVAEVIHRHPEVIEEIVDDNDGEKMAEMAILTAETIKVWADYPEIRD